MPRFILPLNLQFFAEEDDFGGGTPPTSGEDDLLSAIRSLKDSELNGESDDDIEDNADIDEVDDTDVDEDEDQDTEFEDEDANQEDDIEDEPQPPAKRKQSKEDNAKFAQQRREAEAQARIDAEIERLKVESPEFQLAQMLSETYGQPVETIMAQIKEEQLTRQAQEQKVPVEVLRRQRDSDERAQRLEEEINLLKYQNWQTSIRADGSRLMNEYKMLTQEDIDAAQNYILNVARNVDIPLEDAVFAVHGKKIAQALAKGQVQEDLANQSGRKQKTPLAPNNSKPKKVVSLTPDEQAIARAFGMTDDDYNKYKS